MSIIPYFHSANEDTVGQSIPMHMWSLCVCERERAAGGVLSWWACHSWLCHWGKPSKLTAELQELLHVCQHTVETGCFNNLSNTGAHGESYIFPARQYRAVRVVQCCRISGMSGVCLKARASALRHEHRGVANRPVIF